MGTLTFLTEVQANLEVGRPTEAFAAARRMQDLGRRLDEPDLMALGIHAEGRALIRSGHTADGLALVDEAMVTVLDGRLSPFNSWTSVLLHHPGLPRGCRPPSDEPLDRADRAVAGIPSCSVVGGGIEGMCAVHRAQLHLLHGAWKQAEATALADRGSPGLDGDPLRCRGVVRRRRVPSAPRAAGCVRGVRRGSRPGPQPPAGEGAAAARRGRRSGSCTVAPFRPRRRRPRSVAPRAPVRRGGRGRGCGRTPEEAAAAAAELEETASTWATSGLEAMATTARGAVLLAGGRVEESLPPLSEARRRWQELGASYDAARACLLLAEAYRAVGDKSPQPQSGLSRSRRTSD